MINKPALNAWRAKLTAEESKKLLDEANVFGSGVHNVLERAGKGEMIYPKHLRPRVRRCYNAWLTWLCNNDVKILNAEKTFYEGRYGYSGMIDAIAMVNGKRCIVDYKTSKSIYDTHDLQVAAYAKATKGKIEGGYILRFEKDPEKKKDLQIRELTKDMIAASWKVFKACLTIWKWQNRRFLNEVS